MDVLPCFEGFAPQFGGGQGVGCKLQAYAAIEREKQSSQCCLS